MRKAKTIMSLALSAAMVTSMAATAPVMAAESDSTDGFNLNPLDNCLFIKNVTETVRRFRNHPSIALWCARNEGFAPNELEYMLAATLAKEDGSRHCKECTDRSKTLQTGNQ